ncbi:hypothetical protein [Candidatus Nitrososphaera gargensis]|nr:hypothetical protein [Candidatus Nitrososphaera gargensis]
MAANNAPKSRVVPIPKGSGPGGLRSHDFRLSSIEFRRQALYPC